jgi:hypothetical protein
MRFPNCCKHLDPNGGTSPFHHSISLEYYDGVVEGVTICESCSCCVHLKKVWWDDQQDCRIFFGRVLPSKVMEEIRETLRPLGSASSAVWVPIWKEGPGLDLAQMRGKVERTLRMRSRRSFLIESRDPYRTFSQARNLTEQDGNLVFHVIKRNWQGFVNWPLMLKEGKAHIRNGD